jgi:BMFP domain-containing protein YqiC
MICKGVGGSLELLDEGVVIRRSRVLGLFQRLTKGEKMLAYKSISAIQFKRAGILGGYIQFTVSGGNEGLKGMWQAAEDENSLIFADNEKFEEARALIQERMAAPTHVPKQQQSTADIVEKLADLLDRGVLTREEFEAQKALALKTPLAGEEKQEGAPASPMGEEKEEEPASPMRLAMERAIAERAIAPVAVSKSAATNATFGKRKQ